MLFDACSVMKEDAMDRVYVCMTCMVEKGSACRVLV
jgi:hypothetical protein